MENFLELLGKKEDMVTGTLFPKFAELREVFPNLTAEMPSRSASSCEEVTWRPSRAIRCKERKYCGSRATTISGICCFCILTYLWELFEFTTKKLFVQFPTIKIQTQISTIIHSCNSSSG